MKYRQLTLEKRYHISALRKAGLNQKEIALKIGVHPSTISREFRRNNDKDRGYNAEIAQVISAKKHKEKSKKIFLTKPIEKYIRNKLKPVQAHTLTITSDNGKEFSYHEEIAKALDTEFYFANPYQSWQRGLNEHTNGLIREYFPKKMLFIDEILCISLIMCCTYYLNWRFTKEKCVYRCI